MSNNNIDHLFKKALQEQQCDPPQQVWENIEKHLTKRKRLMGAWWLRGVAAAAMIAIGFSLWELYQPEVNSKVVEYTKLEKQAYKPSLFPQGFSQNDSIHPDLIHSVAQQGALQAKQPAVKRAKSELPLMAVQQTDVYAGIRNTTPQPGLKKEGLQRNYIPLTSKEAFRNNQEYRALLSEEVPEERIKDKVKIALSGHFTPGYSSGSYSSSVKNTRGDSYSTDQMDGVMNAGGGLKLSVSTGKRLAFQTGVFYSRMGQKTVDKTSYPRTSALSLGNQETRMATPLGNIKTRRKAVAYRSSEAIVLNSFAANTEETLEQLFGTIEIPLYIHYKLNDNKLSFSLSGGFSGNFIVNNKVYLENDSGRELLGSTEDIRHFNMSTDWGLGMEYPVSRKIKIMIEPGFKYYLQSLSRNSEIDFKPYMFTLSTGIGIEF